MSQKKVEIKRIFILRTENIYNFYYANKTLDIKKMEGKLCTKMKIFNEVNHS